MPSIWVSIKTPFVVKNIKYISTVDSGHIVINLNKFLNNDFQITHSEYENVRFILKVFEDSVKRMFFNRETYELRQALVSKESYFDLALMNFLLSHDEKTEMAGNILAQKISTHQDTEYHDDFSYTTRTTTEYDISNFGITFYKVFAAMSKKCNGKKSLYRLQSVDEWGNPVGKSHYVRYAFDCNSVFEKLQIKKYKSTIIS